MRGGRRHELESYEGPPEKSEWGHEYRLRYECVKCGQRYQVQNSAPSCTIDFILQIEQLALMYKLDNVDQRFQEKTLDMVIARSLHWPKYKRQRFTTDWKRWRQFVLEKGNNLVTQGASLRSV